MITAGTISSFLSLPLFGDSSLILQSFSKLDSLKPNTIVFAKKFKPDYLDMLNCHKNILAIVTEDYKDKLNCPYIISDNPRLAFIRILIEFFSENSSKGSIHPTAVVEDGSVISKDAVIGAFCYVSSGSVIGKNTILHSSVVVDNKAIVGNNCEIKSGVIIGQSGFGFERENNGKPIKFPHFGRVIIGDNVYIGANSAIDRGTLGDTIIEDNVKIDNLVHIAHNCCIGEGSFIIAGSILGGGTKVGKNCWLAPNTSIKEQTRINDGALIGLGAVVLKEVDTNAVVVGNPARTLKKDYDR